MKMMVAEVTEIYKLTVFGELANFSIWPSWDTVSSRNYIISPLKALSLEED